ncbi:MAG: DUF938 domain-containing protein [Alphaproteobacteria bacterium]|nr:DUF938 domain-containing protein [Alphaproteobacteria bacterium]
MSRFFDPGQIGDSDRRHAPATARNRDPILALLKEHLPTEGSLLEVASGTGEHAAYFAPNFPGLDWQPTDIDESHLKSIAAWRAEAQSPNLLAPLRFNVLEDHWHFPHLAKPLRAVMAANLIHISPFAVTEALIAGAGQIMAQDGTLFLYGPYKRDGKHTAPSNEAFDASLKSRDPAWGVRDMEEVVSLAATAGFGEPEVIAMPANNFSLIFKK